MEDEIPENKKLKDKIEEEKELESVEVESTGGGMGAGGEAKIAYTVTLLKKYIER